MDIGKIPDHRANKYTELPNTNIKKDNYVKAGNLADQSTKIATHSDNKIEYTVSMGQQAPNLNTPTVPLNMEAFQKSVESLTDAHSFIDLSIAGDKIKSVYASLPQSNKEIKDMLKEIYNDLRSATSAGDDALDKINSNIIKIEDLVKNGKIDSNKINENIKNIKDTINSPSVLIDKVGTLNQLKIIKGKIDTINSLSKNPAVSVLKETKDLLNINNPKEGEFQNKLNNMIDKYKQAIFGKDASFFPSENKVTVATDRGDLIYKLNNHDSIFGQINGNDIEIEEHETKILTDFFQLMAVFHELGVEMRRMHREGRNLSQESVIEKIELQAEKKLDAAFNNMVAGMVSGSMKVASGGINLIGGAMAAKADAQAAAQGRTDGMAGRVISMRAEGISSVIQGVGEMGSAQFRYMAGIDEAMETQLRADEEQARFTKQHEQDQMDIARDLSAKARDTFLQVFNAWMQSLQKTTSNI